MVGPKEKSLQLERRVSAGAMDVTQVVGALPSPVAPLGAATIALDPSATFKAAATTSPAPMDASVRLPVMMAPGTNMGPDLRKPRDATELKAARESRANEALKMKDEQLRILSDQNSQLLASLDNVEEEANIIQMGKLAVEEENRTLRDQNFEIQSRARAADAQLKKIQVENANKDKQIKILTDQNAELLRLLETEEAQTSKLSAENEVFRKELDALKFKYGALLTTAKTHEEMAARAAREGQLRAEEVRLLRAETENLKVQNTELKMKTQVELEALQEQLRVRKEKQYQLLEKLQGEEEAKRQAEDQVSGMEDKMRGLHGKNIELETQLQLETRARRSQEDNNKKILVDLENFKLANRDLREKIEMSEQERLRMEAEARDSGEQLREMAEKVFQLLERLKLSELGKSKAMEAMRKKEQETIALKKKNARLIKESTREGKARVKAELDKKILDDQIRALKKHNTQISQRCREEVSGKLKEHEERKESEEKLKTLGGRLSFLLNKMQSDEEAKVLAREEIKKMESQIKSLTDRAAELEVKLEEAGESNRIITQALRLKQEELNQLMIRHEALERIAKDYEKDPIHVALEDSLKKDPDAGEGGSAGGDGSLDLDKTRFMLDSKPSLGLLLLKGKKGNYREWLDSKEGNTFLKKAQKSAKCKEMLIYKLGEVWTQLMIEEEGRKKHEVQLRDRDDKIDHLNRKNAYLQDKMGTEEEAKRRTLLRYVHAVKAIANWEGEPPNDKGALNLPDSNVSDEEAHAVAALLKGNQTITELNLRSNKLTDDGARALAAVLAGRTALRSVDLRGNQVGRTGIRHIAEAMERNERVRHVYVHAGGKVEALGTKAPEPGSLSATGSMPMVTVETVCVVDIRENVPSGKGGDEVLLSSSGPAPAPVKGGDSYPSKQQTASTTWGSPIRVNKTVEEDRREKAAKEERRARGEEEQRLKKREEGWDGRFAAMEAPKRPGDLPSLRSTSALGRSSTAGSATDGANEKLACSPPHSKRPK